MKFLGSPIRRQGFARAELLILTGLLLVVLSAIWPVYAIALHRGRMARLRSDFHVIVRSLDRYFNEYGSWPSPFMGGTEDTRYGTQRPNAEVMNVLRAVDGPGNVGHGLNPNRIDFLGVALEEEGLASWSDAPGSVADGEYRDPWGTPYQVVLDTNADESTYAADSSYGKQPEQDLLVWSCGRDRISDTRDDILGWQRPRSAHEQE